MRVYFINSLADNQGRIFISGTTMKEIESIPNTGMSASFFMKFHGN